MRRSLLFIFLALLVILLVFFLLLNFFKIKFFDIKLEKIYCINGEELKRNINIQQKNIIFLDSNSLQKDLKNKYPCLKEVIVSKLFPNKIEINLKGREPFAKIINLKERITDFDQILLEATSSAKMGETFIIDEEGIIFDNNANLDLIEIYLEEQDLKIGQKTKTEDLIKIIKTLKNIGIGAKRLIVVAEETIFTDTAPQILFNMQGDINMQLASLQLILEKAKIDEDSIEFINLKFDKPIVRILHKKK